MREAEKPRLLDEVRRSIRVKHYSIRTEQAYVDWIRRYILYHDKRHPRDLGSTEVVAFLSHLATEGKVAASTQNQALCALLFLYREVLGVDLGWLDDLERAKRPQRLPVVLTQTEAPRVLAHLNGQHWLMASLLYGSGLRLMECVRLRVKDVEFERKEIVVRDDKGRKDRVTMLPGTLVEPLAQHLEKTRLIHQQDLEAGFGEVYLPYALARKYPRAASEWGWQYVFVARRRSIDPRSGFERRHHSDEQSLQRAVKSAVRQANIHKPATSHSFRHGLATALLEAGYGICTGQELLGHSDVRTNAYLHSCSAIVAR